ncbi:nucleoid-associated protein [Romboutsia lituseburensis]|uniref:nucleoid-associated protein n=1 Tax=Romboutsia lituseburensis TaxID=1537 RepID=UPI0022EB3686|nr:nucleoid-associated protein [Romboutsia lituseburensis]
MIIHKFTTHVLDKTTDTPILNDYEGRINPEVDKFLQKIIKKCIKSQDLRKAKFKDYYNNTVNKCCEAIIYNESTFLENSKEIAAYLFDIIKLDVGSISGDLIICLFTIKDEKYIAVMKLDYKNLYNHSIDFENDKFNIQMISNEIGITSNHNIKQAAIISLGGLNDEYHLRVLDKDSEKNDTKSTFLDEFLNIEKVIDDKFKTKTFIGAAHTWVTNALSNDIKQSEDIRSIMNYMLKENSVMDLDTFVDVAIKAEDLKESFKEYMEDREINHFNIDKNYVEQKLKHRRIKTDNGFDLKARLEDFEDPAKYEVKQNPNGSINLTIKNVKFYEEK